jgi:GT2 family glycosyltransferase
MTTGDRSGMGRSEQRAQPRVAILILNWNGMRDTLETLESVNNLRYGNIEIFVVDNGSTDYSREVIVATFPGVHLIVSPENLGVAGGWNLGLQTILGRPEIDYVLFLDNDVIS